MTLSFPISSSYVSGVCVHAYGDVCNIFLFGQRIKIIVYCPCNHRRGVSSPQDEAAIKTFCTALGQLLFKSILRPAD